MKRIISICLAFLLAVSLFVLPVAAAKKPQIKEMTVTDEKSGEVEYKYTISYDKNGRISQVLCVSYEIVEYTTKMVYSYDNKGAVKKVVYYEDGAKLYQYTFSNKYKGNKKDTTKIKITGYDPMWGTEEGTVLEEGNVKYYYEDGKLCKDMTTFEDGSETTLYEYDDTDVYITVEDSDQGTVKEYLMSKFGAVNSLTLLSEDGVAKKNQNVKFYVSGLEQFNAGRLIPGLSVVEFRSDYEEDYDDKDRLAYVSDGRTTLTIRYK